MTPFLVIDSHIHLGTYGNVFTCGWHLPDILQKMDRLGVERAYSSHHKWLAGQLTEGLEASIEAYEESGGRIPFLGVFDPRQDQSLILIDTCLRRSGLVGIKIHPSFHETPADDRGYDAVWDYARDNRIPLIAHTWSSTANPSQALSLPRLFETHVRRCPEVRFVMAHCGGRGDGRGQAIRIARDYPNVYLDIAGDIFCLDLVRHLVDAVGMDRVIYGSDQPWVDARATLMRTYLSEISDEAKRLVLRDNALAVYEPHLLGKEVGE